MGACELRDLEHLLLRDTGAKLMSNLVETIPGNRGAEKTVLARDELSGEIHRIATNRIA